MSNITKLFFPSVVKTDGKTYNEIHFINKWVWNLYEEE